MALQNRNSHGEYQQVDIDLAHYTLLALGCSVGFFLIWNVPFRMICHLRHIACLNNEQQYYYVPGYKWLAILRKHFLYAPLFRTRHHREFQISRAVNMGTLPSRHHACILIAILAMNVAVCTELVPYGTDQVAGIIRNRTGTIATLNLIPLVLLAGRNNPLISLLQIPYDTFNFFHRWLARIVVLEALAHVFAWCIPKAQKVGWDAVRMAIKESAFIRAGLIASCTFALLLIHSPSPIRHAFYETFLHLHIATAATAFIFLWFHLKDRPAQQFLFGAIALWGTERLARILTISYRNCGPKIKLTTAIIEALPGNNILKIALHLPRPWAVTPGQHVYLYIPAIGLWTSRPLSICWSDLTPAGEDEDHGHDDSNKTTMYLLIRCRTGFTDTLARRATKSPNRVISVRAMVEGPYDGIHSLDSYGTIVLFAGGVGITYHLLFLDRLVRGRAMGTLAARRITLVWVIRSLRDLEWIDPWINGILEYALKEEEKGGSSARVLRILVYVTGACDADDVPRGMGKMQIFNGRLTFEKILGEEVQSQMGVMGVLSCGSGGFSDDVRAACRKLQGKTHIELFEESFTW
ncbi:ferric reductase like transmembrane component-domain-containing protein [Aspergillus crustosus]